jgi:hypothetical protein
MEAINPFREAALLHSSKQD